MSWSPTKQATPVSTSETLERQDSEGEAYWLTAGGGDGVGRGAAPTAVGGDGGLGCGPIGAGCGAAAAGGSPASSSSEEASYATSDMGSGSTEPDAPLVGSFSAPFRRGLWAIIGPRNPTAIGVLSFLACV